MNKKYIIYTDGAARGNPGPASAAYVIQTGDGVIWTQAGVRLGPTTNNIAEYTAVKLALEKLIADFSPDQDSVELRSDSLLLVSQLLGRYKVKNDGIRVLFNEIKNLESKIGKIDYIHIPRSKNVLADKLANQALDSEI